MVGGCGWRFFNKSLTTAQLRIYNPSGSNLRISNPTGQQVVLLVLVDGWRFFNKSLAKSWLNLGKLRISNPTGLNSFQRDYERKITPVVRVLLK